MTHATLVERYLKERRSGKSCSMLSDGRAMYSYSHHWALCIRMDTRVRAELDPSFSRNEWYLANDSTSTSTTNSHANIVNHFIHNNKKHACRVDFDHLKTMLGELVGDHERLAKSIVLADETVSGWGTYEVPGGYTLYDWDKHHLRHEDFYSTIRLRHHMAAPANYWDNRSQNERKLPDNYVGKIVGKIDEALGRIQTESDMQNPIIYDKYGSPKIIDANVPGRVLLLQLNERTRRPSKTFLFQRANWRQGGALAWELKHHCKTVREAMMDLKPKGVVELEQKLGRESYRILGYYLVQLDDIPIRKKDFTKGGFWITDTPQSVDECKSRRRGLVSSWGAFVNGQVYGSGAIWPKGRQSEWKMPVLHIGKAGEVFYQMFPANAHREIY